MRNASSGGLAFVDFARLLATGPAADVARILTSTPDLATVSADVGATRQRAADFFLVDIRHYVYGGDTALHIAAAAFRRPIAELLIRMRMSEREIDEEHSRCTTRQMAITRIRQPRQRRSITSCRSVPIRTRSTGREWPLCTEPSEPAPLRRYGRCSTPAPIPGSRMQPARRRCILRFNRRDAEALLPRRRTRSKLPSCSCCSSAERSLPIATERARTSAKQPGAIGFAVCSTAPSASWPPARFGTWKNSKS